MIVVDIASDRRNTGLFVERQHARFEHVRLAAIGIEDPQEPIGVDFIDELAQHPVERSNEPVRPVRTKLARIEDRARGLDGGVDEIELQVVLPQQPVERRVPWHEGFDDLRIDGKNDVGSGVR